MDKAVEGGRVRHGLLDGRYRPVAETWRQAWRGGAAVADLGWAGVLWLAARGHPQVLCVPAVLATWASGPGVFPAVAAVLGAASGGWRAAAAIAVGLGAWAAGRRVGICRGVPGAETALLVLAGALCGAVLAAGMPWWVSALLAAAVAAGTWAMGQGAFVRGGASWRVMARAPVCLAAYLGTSGMHLGPVPLLGALGAAAVAIMGRVRGAGVGAAAGAVLGLAGLVQPGQGLGPGSLALGGVLAGMLQGWGGFPSGAGFLLGALVGTGGTLGGPEAGAAVGSSVAGLLAGALVPDRWVLAATAWLRQREVGGDAPAVPDRLGKLAQVLEEVGRSLEQPLVPLSPASQEERLSRLLDTVMVRVCSSCVHRSACWSRDLFATYRGMLRLLAEHEARAALRAEDLPRHVRRRCPRPGEVAVALTYLRDLQQREREWQGRLRQAKDVVVGQLRGVAQAVQHWQADGEADSAPDGLLGYRVGVARRTRAGQLVSGDAWVSRDLPGGKLLLALADGMGSGPGAALASTSTLGLLEKLLAAGFGLEASLSTVNSLLLLRARGETFSTLDAAVLDRVTGRLRWVKRAAAPGLLVRAEEGRAEVIRSRALPLGVLDGGEAEVQERVVEEGDVLVMVSDGVVDALGEAWMEGYASAVPEAEPQAQAEEMLRRALEQGDARDDLTVLVLRVEAPEARRESPAPPEIRTWHRACS